MMDLEGRMENGEVLEGDREMGREGWKMGEDGKGTGKGDGREWILKSETKRYKRKWHNRKMCLRKSFPMRRSMGLCFSQAKSMTGFRLFMTMVRMA